MNNQQNNPNRPRSNLYSEEWIKGAAKAETEADCNIHVGLELGKNLGKYIRKVKSDRD